MPGTSADAVLDDVAALHLGDPQRMLALVAAAGAQVGEGRCAAAGAGVESLRASPPPRALVVAGMGGSAAGGDVLAALTASSSAVPVIVQRGYGLPSWVGPADLLVAVSCSGQTAETLSAVAEATRRAVPTIGVGAPGSPLAKAVLAADGPLVEIEPAGRSPRACLWAMTTPLLMIADALGAGEFAGTQLDAIARALDEVTRVCAPEVTRSSNPAKELAARLVGELPMVWGFTALAGVAATRFANQLAENANLPALAGASSECQHNQVVALDGVYGSRAGAGHPRLHVVVVREGDEAGPSRVRAELSGELATAAGVSTSILRSPLGTDSPAPARLAALIALGDFASVYLALATGIDPTPVRPITELKSRMAR